MESVEYNEVKKSTRRSKKVKNLEEEVELIFFQDEGNGDVNENGKEMLPKTPSRHDNAYCPDTPTVPQAVLQEMFQTPRRSCRKSIRTTQEYDDIVNKSLRSCTNSKKKHLLVTEEEKDEDLENQEGEILLPKWTPAKVGRVSQKRSRKSCRTEKGKKKEDKKTKEVKVETELAHILVEVTDENVNKELEKKIDHKDRIVEIENIMEQIKVKTDANASKIDNLDKNKNLNEISNLLLEVKNKNPSQTDRNEELVEDKINHSEEVYEIEKNLEHIKDNTELNVFKSDKQAVDDDIDDNDELENHDESIQLVQEDSDDCKTFEQRSEREEICIVYESNISNNKIKVESEHNILSLNSQNTTKLDKLEDSFGCYLKSKQINISDLGLNLLKDEEEEKDVMKLDNQIKPGEEAEEMPSLIVCDEDNEEEGKTDKQLNETFEAKDFTKAVIVDIVEKSSEKPSEEIMETLQISDDEDETTRQRHRVVLLDTPVRSQKNLSALNISAVKINPKEIVLRGIRKRSLSLCINGNEQKCQKFLAGPLVKAKQDRMVSFYSPANQQTIIDDLDIIIAKSLKKQKLQDNKNTLSRFVTTRRKRSISLDECIMSTSQISKLPRPALTQNITNKSKTQTTTSSSKPISRTKLPNFAAIHQKQFKKMESLVEHVSRKEERSKNLINSATKLKPVSARKHISMMKNNNSIANEKPKALKKIDLGATAKLNQSLLNTTTSAAALNRTQDVPVSKVVNLPDPRLAKITKPLKSGSISQRLPQQQPIINYLKTSQTTNIEKPKVNAKVGPSKPTFNLSTSLLVKPTTSSMNTSHISAEDKMASRLQRHMNLFKGRVPSTSAGVSSRKNEVILKGVRSNRRFELQMQHRKNLEQ